MKFNKETPEVKEADESIKIEEEVKKEEKKEDILKEALDKVSKVEKTSFFKVVVASLNVRERPNLNAKPVGIVRSGDILTVIDDMQLSNEWKHVTSPINGYVKSEFVAKSKE